MKKLISSILIFTVIAVFIVSVAAESLSPALNVIAEDYSLTVSALEGETVEFTDKQFTDAAGLEKYSELKIVSLPDEKDGTLCLLDAPVSENQIIPAVDIRNLKFIPEDKSAGASFKFTFDGEYTMTCNIIYAQKQNNAPTVRKNTELSTYISTVCGGELEAHDPDGDNLRFEIVKYPENGALKIENSTGVFRYTPTQNHGYDSFSYRAVDSNGAYSETGNVLVNVMKNESGTVFSDMNEDIRATAAIAMSDKGIMTFTDKNGKKVFAPGENVSRLDFLVAAMNVFGASNIPKVESTGFNDDSDIPAKYKGYVYSAAKLGIISGVKNSEGVFFYPDRPISAAEAATILNNVIGYVPETMTSVSPVWASEAVSAMNELGVYSPADTAATMNKADAAQMLYCINCLLYE